MIARSSPERKRSCSFCLETTWCLPETYWHNVRNMRRGYLKEEFEYYLECILDGNRLAVITPEESRSVVAAIRAAEESERGNRVFEF